MSTPPRGREEIRADPEAFKASLNRAREAFRSIDGVLSVGAGQKETSGEYRDQIAIVVVVREKRPLETLAPSERIPPTFDGYLTDVAVVGEGSAMGCDNTALYPEITGGIQITPENTTGSVLVETGTLGCIVRRRGDSGRENVYILSNKHVLHGNGAGEGDYVYHPWALPNRPAESLGPIQPVAFEDNVPYKPPGAAAEIDFYLDCGTARLVIDSKCLGSTCTKDTTRYAPSIIDLALGEDDPATPEDERNLIADVRSVIDDPLIIGQPVFKVGRTTGKTAGIVRLIADALDINDGALNAKTLIKIDFDPTTPAGAVNCKGNERFAEHGDSGSVVVDAQRRVIGLLAIGAPRARDADPPPKKWATWACHIRPVLDKLGICIATTGGVAYGSCSATDGSGTTPVAVAELEAPEGQIVFSAHAVEDARTLHDIVEPIAVSPAERSRLLGLRDALRETERGRELHDTFGNVRREIGYLIRNSRAVKVVWHRCRGPAFLVATLKHLKGEVERIPLEIDGVSRAQLLSRMARALSEHGSNPLHGAIERYQQTLMPMLSTVTTVDDCLEWLSENDRELERGSSDGESLATVAVARAESDQ